MKKGEFAFTKVVGLVLVVMVILFLLIILKDIGPLKDVLLSLLDIG